MRRVVRILLLLIAAGAAATLAWWLTRPRPEAEELVLYGNVDLRQVQLAFNNSERIAAVLAQEGDRVYQGQVLARLDTTRLAPQVAQAEAQAAAQRQVFERLRNGTRPEEIAQARAQVDSARADVTNARRLYNRVRNLFGRRAGSEEDVEKAQAILDVAEAKLVVAQKALD